MARFRLYPTPAQEKILRKHCEHARFVWNLGQEQRLMYRPERGPTPDYYQQKRQLTEARNAEPWLSTGSATVQQEALRDLDQAWRNFFRGTHGRPTWRKQGIHEGFRVVGTQARRVEALNRHWSWVLVPKVGWVRFRRSRPVPDAKSYRVNLDRSGRWHVAFAAIPAAMPRPGTGEVIGVDRGVVITAALSDGRELHCPGLSRRKRAALRKAQRRAERAPKDSAARNAEYAKVGRIRGHEADIRKDWVEKTSTDLARSFDVIRFEDLKIKNMTASARGTVEAPGRNVRQKAGLNRAILAQGWGMLTRRTEQKAPGRVQKVPAPYTSLRCSDCGWIDKNSRKSQAEYVCSSCGFTCNADENAALNIAAGQCRRDAPSVREPQPNDLRVA